MRRLTTVLALAAVLSAGCSDTGLNPAVRAFAEPHIRVTADAQSIHIENVGQATVGFAAFSPNILALIEWAPCADAARCGGLRPGQTATVRYADITGYQPGDSTAVVYYWRMSPGGYGPGEVAAMRSVDVNLYRLVALGSSR